jgi:hypothetical protein
LYMIPIMVQIVRELVYKSHLTLSRHGAEIMFVHDSQCVRRSSSRWLYPGAPHVHIATKWFYILGHGQHQCKIITMTSIILRLLLLPSRSGFRVTSAAYPCTYWRTRPSSASHCCVRRSVCTAIACVTGWTPSTPTCWSHTACTPRCKPAR